MKAAILSLLGGIAATLPHLAGADCLYGGDMMLIPGQSGGHIGYECRAEIDDATYDGMESVCGSDGEMVEVEKQFRCEGTTPYCVQCGPRCYGGALCLSSPDIGARPCPDTCWQDDTDEDDDESFLPPSTPAAIAAPIMFDMCESDSDVAIWTSNGGEATLAEHVQFCEHEFDGGTGCKLDYDCYEGCFQQTYGYSEGCSKCFGAIPQCVMNEGCPDVCDGGWTGEACEMCIAPCVDELDECAGLPEIPASVVTPAPNWSIPAEPVTTPPATNEPTPPPTPGPTPNLTDGDPTPSPIGKAPGTTSSPTPMPSPDPTPSPIENLPGPPDPTPPPAAGATTPAETNPPTSPMATPPTPGSTTVTTPPTRPGMSPRPTNEPTTASPVDYSSTDSPTSSSPGGVTINPPPGTPPTNTTTQELTGSPTSASGPAVTPPGLDRGGPVESEGFARKSVGAVSVAAMGLLAFVLV